MSHNPSWREIAAPIIHKTLEENKGKSEKEIKAAIRDAYPFGQRAMHATWIPPSKSSEAWPRNGALLAAIG